ncbi:CUGBP Elav-like family member 5 [Taenia solium]|eukprot:TsM_000547500 transcript=TsM_000547500 gene=TsM_000547500
MTHPNLSLNVEASEAHRTGARPYPVDYGFADVTATIPDLTHPNQLRGYGCMYGVFVWNLPPGYALEELDFYFAPYGSIEEGYLANNLARTDGHFYAIVRYDAYASGRDAVLNMNSRVINGHRLKVMRESKALKSKYKLGIKEFTVDPFSYRPSFMAEILTDLSYHERELNCGQLARMRFKFKFKITLGDLTGESAIQDYTPAYTIVHDHRLHHQSADKAYERVKDVHIGSHQTDFDLTDTANS